jgi:hypothetical protein
MFDLRSQKMSNKRALRNASKAFKLPQARTISKSPRPVFEPLARWVSGLVRLIKKLNWRPRGRRTYPQERLVIEPMYLPPKVRFDPLNLRDRTDYRIKIPDPE